METKIVYCDQCGEYLGDRIDGVLYRFGVIVNEDSHICPPQIKPAQGETHWDQLELERRQGK